MPRIESVSCSSTVWLIRRRPMLWTIAACFLSNPIVLLTSVTLTRFVSADFFAAFFAISLLDCRHLFEVLAAQPGDGRRRLETLESVEGSAHDVVRIRGAERLGQHVVQPRRFHDRAHGAAGD